MKESEISKNNLNCPEPNPYLDSIERIKKLEKEIIDLKNLREEEFKKRMDLAKEAMELVKSKLSVINWKVTGSTSRGDFGFSSDLDIDILLKESPNKKEYRFLNEFITKKYLIEKDLLIQFFITTLEDLEVEKNSFKEMYSWYCNYFGITSSF